MQKSLLLGMRVQPSHRCYGQLQVQNPLHSGSCSGSSNICPGRSPEYMHPKTVQRVAAGREALHLRTLPQQHKHLTRAALLGAPPTTD